MGADPGAVGLELREGVLNHPQVLALLRYHLDEAHKNSPPGAVFAFEPHALAGPDIVFLTGWMGEACVVMGALKWLNSSEVELKSMRTHPDFARQGLASSVLQALLSRATQGGARRAYLETGSNEAFAAARAFYARHGFSDCGPFGAYKSGTFSHFMVRDL